MPDNVFIMRMRGKLISPFFKNCGENLRVARGNVFYNSFNITIGKNVYIAFGNWFSGSTDIIIEDEVMFGPKSIIISGNHKRKNGSFRYGTDSLKPIKIKFGSWIGGNCAILAGSIIGKGSIIGANTVTNGIIPDDCIYAGNPGVVKKTIND
jgi:maltose O-acetyltransferase